MRFISNRSGKALSSREGAAEPYEQKKYLGGRMDTGTICELMIVLLYLIKFIIHL